MEYVKECFGKLMVNLNRGRGRFLNREGRDV